MRWDGKLIIKFDLEGIWFSHKGDEVLWYWPWVRPSFRYDDIEKIYRVYSLNLDQKFASLDNYKKSYSESGMKEKVEGFVFKDLLYNWVKVSLS